MPNHQTHSDDSSHAQYLTMNDTVFTAWYLIIGKGNLTLRLNKNLSVGENDQGELTIDDREALNRWLKLSPEGNQLLVEVTRKDIVLIGEDGPLTLANGETKIEPGTLILLPECELYLGTQISRGVPIARVTVEIGRVEESSEQPPAKPVLNKAPAIIEFPAAGVPVDDVAADLQEYAEATAPTLVSEAQVNPQPAKTPVQNGPRRFAYLASAVLIAVSVFYANEIWHVGSKSGSVTDRSTNSIPATEPHISDVQSRSLHEIEELPNAESAVIADSEQVSDTSSVVVPAPTAIAQVQSVETSAPYTAPDPIAEQFLANARRHLEEGYIITPAPNGRTALNEISQVLFRDPSNKEALDLMTVAAERVLLDAKSAYEAGSEYEARNILEELLAFHPTHPEANRVWKEWTR